MFRDIDVQLKEFAKDMKENNETLVNILTKVLNPNAVVPDGFGVGLNSDHIPSATPKRFNSVIPSTTSKNSGDTVLASNSSFSSTADNSSSPLSLTGSYVSPSGDLTQNSSCCHVLLSDENIDTVLDSFSYPSISASNSTSSSTPGRGNTNSSTLPNSHASPPLFEENLIVQPIKSEEDSDVLSNYINSSTPARSYTNLCTSVSSYGRSPMSEGNLMVQPVRSGDHCSGLVCNSHVLSSSYTNSSTPARSYTNLCTSASNYGSSPISKENLMVQPVRSGDHCNGLVCNSHVLSSSYTNSSTPARSYTNFRTLTSSYGSSPMSEENLMVQPVRSGDHCSGLVCNSHVLSSSYTNSSTPARSYTNFRTLTSSYGSSPMSKENLMVQPIRSGDHCNGLVSTSHVLSSSYTNSLTPARGYTNLRTSPSSYGSSPMSEENLMVQPIRSGDHCNGLVSNSHVLSSSYRNSSTPARSFTNLRTSASTYGSSPMPEENLMVQPITSVGNGNVVMSSSRELSTADAIHHKETFYLLEILIMA